MSIDKIVKVFVNNKPRALEYVIYEGQIIIKCKSISISNVIGYFNKSLFRLLERRLNTVGPSSAMTSDEDNI